MLAGAAAKSAQGTLNGYPPEMYAIFAGLSLWAALWDLTALTQGRLSRRARLARHLWRMGLALTIAAAAFFLGQPDYFPETLRGSPLLAVPPLAALGATLVWFARVWLTNTFKERDGR
jgi:peptidoglycan/LPS O-acetylase OafA/YrhL